MQLKTLNVTEQKSIIQKGKDSLNNSASKKIKSDLNSNQIWVSASKHNLEKSLGNIDIINGKIESTIAEINIVLGLIQKYQELQKKLADLKSQYSALAPQLYYEETYEYTDYSSGTPELKEEIITVKNTEVESQLFALDQEIQTTTTEMEAIRAQLN